jgi:pyruvate formate lyase activating enzyme
MGKSFRIRIPLIEGINADEENIEQTALFLRGLPSSEDKCGRFVNLLPYHDVGKDKHRRMWSTYNPQGYSMSTPSEETLQRCAAQMEAHGLHVVVGG